MALLPGWSQRKCDLGVGTSSAIMLTVSGVSGIAKLPTLHQNLDADGEQGGGGSVPLVQSLLH